jgi:pilus assembly protein Flp/PilA
MKLFTRFLNETDGQDLIEYGLLLAIIAVGIVAVIPQIALKVTDYFTDLNTALPAAD